MIYCVVGARPNFMKMAPVLEELERRGIPHQLIHTGQHYDDNMSAVFFQELGMPVPDAYLGVGSKQNGQQIAEIMMRFGELCRKNKPSLVVVAGDVNSTLAAALAAAAEKIPLAHIEAGLRSFDRTMPEEINRIVTDHLSELLFTTEESANQNLKNEGIPGPLIHFVGDCMVDSLMKHLPLALERKPWEGFNLKPGSYALLTLHRPSNVDEENSLLGLMKVMNEISARTPVLFPVHPRTREHLGKINFKPAKNFRLAPPLSYLAFLGLMAKARFVMTDSGGIQEETTALKVPCLTLRRNTERPVTIQKGTNQLVKIDAREILDAVKYVLKNGVKKSSLPQLWDGSAAVRIVDRLESYGQKNKN